MKKRVKDGMKELLDAGFNQVLNYHMSTEEAEAQGGREEQRAEK